MMKSLLLIPFVVFSFSAAHAQEVQTAASKLGFYTVKEQSLRGKTEETLMDPLSVIANISEDSEFDFQELASRVYSLVNFEFHNEKYGNTRVPYNRLKHFGTWIRDPNDNTCYNTRAKVLIRDSQGKVSFSSGGCSVTRGKWVDPYTGDQFTDASDVQIDHFVPLKNSYLSGAYKWNRKKRCLFANFEGNDFHLLAVSGIENQSKSDHGPDGYMPPRAAYQCQYLAQWLKIKLIWELALSPDEKNAVLNLIQANHCRADELTFSSNDLESQRRFIDDNMDLCP